MTTRMSRVGRRLLMVHLCGLMTVMGCESSCKRQEDTKKESSVGAAATVNNVDVKTAELDILHARAKTQFTRTGRPISPELDKNLRGSILRKMIDDEIIKQRAEKEGVKVDRIERVDALEKYKTKMGGPKNFQLFLERSQLTEEQMTETIVADLQRDKLIQKLDTLEEPTEAEILSHYRGNEKLYTQPEMVRARHILLKLDAKEPQEKADLVLKKAQQILAEANKPDASFAALVQKYSEGPSVKNGGDLGFFERGRMNKEFEDIAFNAPLKKAVGPVRTDFGYHVIFVEEKSEPRAARIEDVRPRIVEFIKRNKRARKSEELLTDLRESATVTISDPSMTYEEYKKESARAQVTEQAAANDVKPAQ